MKNSCKRGAGVHMRLVWVFWAGLVMCKSRTNARQPVLHLQTARAAGGGVRSPRPPSHHPWFASNGHKRKPSAFARDALSLAVN